MFKYYLCLIVIVFIQLQLAAQCPSGNLILTSQTEVEAFIADYPNCSIINGDLRIGSFGVVSDIQNLSGLRNLTRIRGSLDVFSNPNLTTLDGLENIAVLDDSPGGDLLIHYNASLTSIAGIQGLRQERVRSIRINHNPQLATCTLPNICQHLGICDGRYTNIHDNAAGCESITEVMMSCGVPAGESFNKPLGLPINLSFGHLLDFRLSEDGSKLFVARQIPYSEDEFHVEYRLVANVYEWNDTAWVDMGQSPILSLIRGGSSQYSSQWFDVTFSPSGEHLAIINNARWDSGVIATSRTIWEWTGENNWEKIWDGDEFYSRYASSSLSNGGERFVQTYGGDRYDDPLAWVIERNGSAWTQVGATFTEDQNGAASNRMVLSADGSQLVVQVPEYDGFPSSGDYLQLYEWDGAQWIRMPYGDPDLGQAAFYDFDADGDHLIAKHDGQIKYYNWNGSTWELLSTIDAVAEGDWQLSDDATRIYSNHTSTLFLWDGTNWNESRFAVFPYCNQNGLDFSFSGDGRRVALAFPASTRIAVYDVDADGFLHQLPSVCSDVAEVQTFEQAVRPAGGTFSGAGIRNSDSDDGFVFDPVVAGVGTHVITYNTGEEVYYDSITVTEPIVPTLDLPDTLRVTRLGLRNSIPGTGSPEGGVYEDDLGLLTDNGDGTTFKLSFGQASKTITVTYTITDESACIASVAKTLTLIHENPAPNQLGGDLFDIEGLGKLGFSVSLSDDGTRMAVGDPVPDRGVVYVYHLMEGRWVQMATLTPMSPWNDRFGTTVTLSGDGNSLLVSDPEFSFYDADSRYFVNDLMQMYRWDGADWVSLGSDYSRNLGVDNNNLVDISRDGSIIGLGATLCRDTNDSLDCSIPTYENGSNLYAAHALALSADGNRIVFSDPARRYSADTIGYVLVYDWNGSQWEQVGQRIDKRDWVFQINASVDITDDGRRIVIGSPQTSIPGSYGYVEVYDWNGTDWQLVGAPITSRVADEGFGASVKIVANGNRLVITAPNYERDTGRTYIYNWGGTEWQLEEDFWLTGGDQQYDRFGTSIAASIDGKVIAVGAIQDNNPRAGGYVRVFGIDCSTPEELAASDVSENSAVISWAQTDNTALSWDVELVERGGNSTERLTYTNLDDLALDIEGLRHSTRYAAYVRSVCESSSSAWAGPLTFTTPELMPDEVRGVFYDPNGIIGGDPDGMRIGNSPINARVAHHTQLPEQVIGLQLSPNPTRDQFNLSLRLTKIEDVQLSLYDIYGQRLWSGSSIEAQTWVQNVDLSTYPEGTYILHLRIGEQPLTRRIIKLQ